MADLAGTTVVLADDHAIVREGFAALCEAHGLRVLGQCAEGPAAVEMILAKQPDFAILDLSMPGMTGIEVIRRLRNAGCPSKLIILSVNREDKSVIEALRAGADAYLTKEGPARHLWEAIGYIRDGGQYVSPLLKRADLFAKPEPAPPDDPLACLSPREIEVFSSLVKGMRAKDIAELLRISPKTVDTYRAILMRKLNVHDIVGLVKFAIERNLTGTSR